MLFGSQTDVYVADVVDLIVDKRVVQIRAFDVIFAFAIAVEAREANMLRHTFGRNLV